MQQCLLVVALSISTFCAFTVATAQQTRMRVVPPHEADLVRGTNSTALCYDTAACAPGTACVLRCATLPGTTCTKNVNRPYQLVFSSLGFKPNYPICVDEMACTYAVLSETHCF